MREYPNPCDTCKEAETCTKGTGCSAWLTRYRYRQKQINAYARKKKAAYLKKHFVYNHPDETRRYLQNRPCDRCMQQYKCNVPCAVYLSWYNARLDYARKVAKKRCEQE